MLINGELWYGYSNGYFYHRSFNRTTFGPGVYTGPHNDPHWSNVSTGVGQTYRGAVADGLNWSDAGGNVISGNKLYVSTRSTGTLYRFDWDGTKAVAAGAVAVSGPTMDGRDWRANGMFLGS